MSETDTEKVAASIPSTSSASAATENPKPSAKDGPIAITATPTATEPGQVSAVTISRMMGLATATEVRLLEGKLDLISTKLNAVTAKLEKLSGVLNNAPTGSDLERIDVQVGALRSMLAESMQRLFDQAGIQQPQKEDEKLTVDQVKEKLAKLNKTSVEPEGENN